MMDVKHCSGCYDDFYNGKVNFGGVEGCWNRKDATLVSRLLIHVDQAPPYKHLKPETVPSCYKRQRFVTVKPESIDAAGYWKR